MRRQPARTACAAPLGPAKIGARTQRVHNISDGPDILKGYSRARIKACRDLRRCEAWPSFLGYKPNPVPGESSPGPPAPYCSYEQHGTQTRTALLNVEPSVTTDHVDQGGHRRSGPGSRGAYWTMAEDREKQRERWRRYGRSAKGYARNQAYERRHPERRLRWSTITGRDVAAGLIPPMPEVWPEVEQP